VTKSRTEEQTEADRETFAASLSVGIEASYLFLTASASTTVAWEFEKEYSRTLSNMLETASETTFTATCESEDKTEPVAMWQYKMWARRIDSAGVAQAETSETTCTRGANVNVQPKCPPNYKCADETCSKCDKI